MTDDPVDRYRDKQQSRRAEMARQFHDAHDAVSIPLIEPTKDELRNGWTAETLAAYHAEQSAAQTLRIDPHSALRKTRPIVQGGRRLAWTRNRG